jgi:type I restriction enzyme, S subunit
MTDTPRRTSFATLIEEGLLEIGDGYRAKNEELGGTGPIFLRAGHVRDTHIDFAGADRFHAHLAEAVVSKMARPGDTVITTKGNSTGRTSYVDEGMPSFAYSPHLSFWRTLQPDLIDSLFLRYWARGPEFQQQLDGMKVSTDMAPYLSLADQRRLRISLPPIGQQRNLGLLLGALDDKIALNRRMNHTLEATAAALFRSWFVDFDPVVAKAEGRRAAGVHPQAQQHFPSGFEADEAVLPLGWRRESVDALLTLQKTTIFPGDFPGADFDHYSIPAFDDDQQPAREPGASIRSNKFQVPPGTLLIAKLNPGTSRVWWPSGPISDESICSTEFLVCEPRPGIPLEFLYVLFKSEEFVTDLASLVTGTSNSHQRVRPSDFLALPVLRPASECLSAFADVVSPLLQRSRLNAEENRTLAALRDTLLPQLLSGAIRLRDAERAVGTAI